MIIWAGWPWCISVSAAGTNAKAGVDSRTGCWAGVDAGFVHQGQARDVKAVTVDGRWLMRDGTVLTMDEAAIVPEANHMACTAWQRLFTERPDCGHPLGFA